MIRGLRHLVRTRGNRDRQLIIAGSILAVICVGLFINLTIMLTNNDENKDRRNNETISNRSILTTTDFHSREMFQEHAILDPVKFRNSSYLLDNAFYFNFALLCRVDGFVVSINLRLFSEWKGHEPLFLFVISSLIEYKISYRFPVNPHRNTTEWQTIKIPSGAIPISISNLFGIGMHENSGTNNEIYAVEIGSAMAVIGVHANTTFFNIDTQDYGVAFGYTVVYDDR